MHPPVRLEAARKGKPRPPRGVTSTKGAIVSSTEGLYGAVQRGIIKEMLRLATSDNKANIVRAIALAEKITPDNHKAEMRFVKEKVQEDHPALNIARHVVRDLSPSCRDGFINAFVVNALLRGSQKRQAYSQKTGMRTPFTVLVSPTMRCNLHCEGCYASEYSPQSDMSGALFQRIVDEAAEMGVYLITVLGGEPFMRRDLLDIAAANPDTYFQVFSNGTLIKPEQIARIAELGNVALMLSIEGDEQTTDARRGAGTYRKLLGTMELLKKHGVLFGYSATVTRTNWQMLLSDEFVDPLVERGAAISWHFLYMPVGGAPDMSLMPTAEQRNEFRLGIQRLRNTKAMFPVDFWGDAPWVGGCIAGKHYLHINNEGWVEPCIFTHFATDNIAETSLAAAFNSLYFREIRARQPFNHNLLMPCMLIDNPCQSREIMAASGARPTHEGAESLVTGLCGAVDAYSADVSRVYEPLWSEPESEVVQHQAQKEPDLVEL
jgi:MoaA/NifB/PqqE/SkfB family radical SAM enzyme